MDIRRTLLVCAALTLTVFPACELLQLDTDTTGTFGKPTETQIVAGLRDALSVGIDTAATRLAKTGGYYLDDVIRILLPQDVQQALDFADAFRSKMDPTVLATIQFLSVSVFDFTTFDGIKDSLKESINRAAEHAAPLSVDIFKNAIIGMTINDGMTILTGDSTEATGYLYDKTFVSLTGVYSPFVDRTLSLVGAHQLWSSISTNYNSMITFYYGIEGVISGLPEPPFDTLTTDLAAFTTEKALGGLFVKVGEQEALIRRDPIARVTDILKTVFDWLDEQT